MIEEHKVGLECVCMCVRVLCVCTHKINAVSIKTKSVRGQIEIIHSKKTHTRDEEGQEVDKRATSSMKRNKSFEEPSQRTPKNVLITHEKDRKVVAPLGDLCLESKVYVQEKNQLR